MAAAAMMAARLAHARRAPRPVGAAAAAAAAAATGSAPRRWAETDAPQQPKRSGPSKLAPNVYVKKGYQPGPQEQLWRPPKADGSELLRRPASELFPKPPTTQAEFRALGKEAVQEALDPANEMDAYDAIDHILSTLYPDGPNVTWRYKYPEGYRIPEVLPLPLELLRRRNRRQKLLMWLEMKTKEQKLLEKLRSRDLSHIKLTEKVAQDSPSKEEHFERCRLAVMRRGEWSFAQKEQFLNCLKRNLERAPSEREEEEVKKQSAKAVVQQLTKNKFKKAMK